MSKKGKVDNFIGTTFPTPKGGVLTVTGISKNKSDATHKKYLCSCSICSLDEELFPDLFEIRKSSLLRSCVPCGCSWYKWNKQQYSVLVRRECLKRGYVKFNGFYGLWLGCKTKLNLECLIDGNTWETTSIVDFLNGNGCPICRLITIKGFHTKPDQYFINQFIDSGNFRHGCVFTRNRDKRSKGGSYCYWDMYCPVCSEDELVTNGLCSGIFTSSISNLQRGMVPCRCGQYHYTKKQQEYRLKAILEENNLKWGGWKGKYTGVDSKFIWYCSEDHLCDSSTVYGFLKGRRCDTCRGLYGTGNGYYADRESEVDYLYAMDFISSIKVGRTFNIEERRSSTKSLAKLQNKPKIIQLYTATHKVVYETEQAIHEQLRSSGFQFKCDWTTECFSNECLEVLHDLLDNYVEGGVLKRVHNIEK